MSRLGLQSFERHASLAQPGKAGMAQAVALDAECACFLSVILHDSIQSCHSERLAPVVALQDEKYPI